jgi:peptidoglycan/LPS O-acetylase OafA/YrhL
MSAIETPYMAASLTGATGSVTDGRRDMRVRGLDTLRFVLALWVVLGHSQLPQLGIDDHHLVGKLLHGIYNNLISGPAAVIVFFVISGFCIHYPYRRDKKLLLIPYFARRHLRIWVPIIVAVLVGRPLGVNLGDLQDSILWSLLAEEIYYLIYPALLFFKRRFGWIKILSLSYVGAISVIMQNPSAANYPSYGPYLNWLLGLPCWLLGCCLVDRVDRPRGNATGSEIHIWRWRMAAWFLSWVCSAMRFHTPVKYPWTLTLFAVFAYFWLEKEILYYQTKAPSTSLENAGKGSYSIYLVHLIGFALFSLLPLPASNTISYWFVQIVFTVIVCYIFYLLVEKPSHLLARRLAERLSPRVPVPRVA